MLPALVLPGGQHWGEREVLVERVEEELVEGRLRVDDVDERRELYLAWELSDVVIERLRVGEGEGCLELYLAREPGKVAHLAGIPVDDEGRNIGDVI